ncbi:MAG: DUF805 domain-containing protein [Alphaproteobacteria bacterium]|nr:DUF805 domain-containing protein [Alphaproteobacteria bacterium]
MFNYYVTCLQKYVDFSGRATRSEYWYFALVNFLIALILELLGLDLISGLYGLFVLIPGWAVFCRRMHDTNRSGWNWLWLFLPLIGFIIVLVYLVSPTKAGENKYVKAAK